MLLLQRSDGSLHQLQHFYWNVHWNANFIASSTDGSIPGAIRAVPDAGKNLYHFGPFIEGEVMDSRFAALINQAISPTCNTVAGFENIKMIVKEGK